MSARHRSRSPRPRKFVVLVLAGLLSVGLLPGAAMGAPPPPPIVEPTVQIEIGDAAMIETSSTSRSVAGSLVPPGSSAVAYVPAGLVTKTNWPSQGATEPDPTTNPQNKITARLLLVVQSTRDAGLVPLSRMTCVSGRALNPSSDHPLGRACDFMFDYRTPAGIEAGWRTANWLLANQAVLGIRYLIWQGQIWNASSRPGPWTVYNSTSYGCPNPANITGCHYDHVHISVY